jgi:CubicO group peptidase (beta-lactamase class C family)
MNIDIKLFAKICIGLVSTTLYAQNSVIADFESLPLRQRLSYLFVDTVMSDSPTESKSMFLLTDLPATPSITPQAGKLKLWNCRGNNGSNPYLADSKLADCISDSVFIAEYFAWFAQTMQPKGILGIYYSSRKGSSVFFPRGDDSSAPLKYDIVSFPKRIKRQMSWHIDRGVGMIGNLTVAAVEEEVSLESLLGSRIMFFDDGVSIEKLARAIESKEIDEKVVNKMIREILGVDPVVPVRFSFPNITAQAWQFDAQAKGISAFARHFSPVTDMTDVEIGVWGTSSAVDFNVVQLLKRYTDKVFTAHPSVLSNASRLKYFVVAASSHDEIVDVAQMIGKIVPKFDNQVVLLFSGCKNDSILSDSLINVFDAVFVAPGDPNQAFDLLTQSLMGGVGVNNTMPVPQSLKQFGFGNVKIEKTRLGYSFAEAEGMNQQVLNRIDQLMADMIKLKASPGGQVLVARHGSVVLSHSYGHDTYSRNHPVDNESIYDLASVTKVMATTPLLMRLFDQKLVDGSSTLGQLLPNAYNTDKADITVRDIMLHQSGLPASIPYSLYAIDSTSLTGPLYRNRFSKEYGIRVDNRLYMFSNVRYKSTVFSSLPDSVFDVRVAEGLFMNRHNKEEMIRMLYTVPLRSKIYRYSDLSLYFAQQIVEKYLKDPENVLFDRIFAQPLGAQRLTFLPLDKFKPSEIMPTENDISFRRETLRGYVHDPGAAMMGGVAGHAGLFSNANDLAKMAQMLLNGGKYGGLRFVDSVTVAGFTSLQVPGNRRGLGFDKPEPDTSVPGPCSELASSESYGHSGFTGTFVWIDPKYELVYIFLSNRVHPHAYNKKLLDMSVRRKVQTIIYESIVK